MAERAAGELSGFHVETIEPVAHHRAAGRMRDADEPARCTDVFHHVGDGGIESARDVLESDFVAEADVLAEIDVVHVERRSAVLSGFALQARRQFTVGIGVGDAPAMHEYDKQ